MRILVCGDRNWTDRGKVRARLKLLPRGTTIIHGDARGADRMIHDLLTNRRNRMRGTRRARKVIVHGEKGAKGSRPGGTGSGDIIVHAYPADWLRYEDRPGRNPAGVIRNGQMLSDFNPDIAIYFHDELVVGQGGTGDMVARCQKADVPVYDWESFVTEQWR